MEIIFEVLLQLLCELFIQLLFELGFRGFVGSFKERATNPYLAFFSYALTGLLAGVLSLIFFPTLMVKNPDFRIAGLVIIPCLAGLAMSAIGKLREKNSREVIRMDKFVFGATFAFAMALVRFLSLNSLN